MGISFYTQHAYWHTEQLCVFSKTNNMKTLTKQIKALLVQLQQGIYEKNTETSMALLAALAGESVLLLGPPGVAKSMVARRLKKAFKGARSFEYLMSRFSTPDEIFGPVSISRLKTSDAYVRATEGYLPTAEVVFLDEIWKAGPAIQNTLLTVMNEKLFRNGNEEVHLPLKLLVAASNELPAKGEGLEALWDRFIVRIVSHGIADDATFRQMLCEDDVEAEVDEALTISDETYHQWQREAKRVGLSPLLLDAITQVRGSLERVSVEQSELPRAIYVSDRRWKHVAGLLRMSAYLQGRREATAVDLLPMYHCLWNETEEIASVRAIVVNAIFAPYAARLQQIANAVRSDLRACSAKEALAKAVRENDHRDDNLAIVDRYFYQIAGHGTGNSYVFIADFKRLPLHSKLKAPVAGILYPDPSQPKRSIVRIYSAEMKANVPAVGCERVTLSRDDNHIFINGVAFKMREQGEAQTNPAKGKVGDLFSGLNEGEHKQSAAASSAHYEENMEKLCTDLEQLQTAYSAHLFTTPEDVALADARLQELYKQVALCRVDVRKLLYDEE